MISLTRSNYHTPAANTAYMSHSQYQSWLKCEEATLAKISGTWQEPHNDAFLIGSYVHAWNEGTLEEFKANNPDMYTKKGELYAKYQQADLMIERLSNDAFCQFLLRQGEKEVILTAEFAGCEWRIMMDIYCPSKNRYVELKTTCSVSEKIWSKEDRQKVSFIEAYGYLTQAAIYTEIERLATCRDGYLEPILVAVSRETPPDLAIISLENKERREYELNNIKLNMPRILAIKRGSEKALRCEKCAYCRNTKKITKIIHYTDL